MIESNSFLLFINIQENVTIILDIGKKSNTPIHEKLVVFSGHLVMSVFSSDIVIELT